MHRSKGATRPSASGADASAGAVLRSAKLGAARGEVPHRFTPGGVASPQKLWDDDTQRLAEVAVSRQLAAGGVQCFVCGWAVADHTEAHAVTCYRIARLLGQRAAEAGA